MRIFIALDLPNTIKDYLFTLQKHFPPNEAKIHWVAKKNLHLTLKFFGDLPDSQLDSLKKNLQNVHYKPFTAHLTHLGIFPSFPSPRVLWIDLEPATRLIQLQKLIDQETLRFGKQEHTFQAHITLGRIKMLKYKDLFRKKVESFTSSNLSLSFTTFTLYKSILTRDGPIYEALEYYPLPV